MKSLMVYHISVNVIIVTLVVGCFGTFDLGTYIYGSPNWNLLLSNDSGTYLSADEAKAIFHEGFELIDLKITELNY